MAKSFSPIPKIRERQMARYSEEVKRELKDCHRVDIDNIFKKVCTKLLLEGEKRIPQDLQNAFRKAKYGFNFTDYPKEEFEMPKDLKSIPGIEKPRSIIPMVRSKEIRTNEEHYAIFKKLERESDSSLIQLYCKELESAYRTKSIPDQYLLSCIHRKLLNSSLERNGRNSSRNPVLDSILSKATMHSCDFPRNAKARQQVIMDSLYFVDFFQKNPDMADLFESSEFQKKHATSRLRTLTEVLNKLKSFGNTKGEFYEFIQENIEKYQTLAKINEKEIREHAEYTQKQKTLQEKNRKRDERLAEEEKKRDEAKDEARRHNRADAEASGLSTVGLESGTPPPGYNTPPYGVQHSDHEIL